MTDRGVPTDLWVQRGTGEIHGLCKLSPGLGKTGSGVTTPSNPEQNGSVLLRTTQSRHGPDFKGQAGEVPHEPSGT